MQDLLRNGASVTAVVCSNDLTAIGAMETIYERGLRIPEDISVVGYDNILLSAYTRPGLTTVNVPREKVASAAFLSLLSRGQEGEFALTAEHVFLPELVCRSSTAKPGS